MATAQYMSGDFVHPDDDALLSAQALDVLANDGLDNDGLTMPQDLNEVLFPDHTEQPVLFEHVSGDSTSEPDNLHIVQPPTHMQPQDSAAHQYQQHQQQQQQFPPQQHQQQPSALTALAALTKNTTKDWDLHGLCLDYTNVDTPSTDTPDTAATDLPTDETSVAFSANDLSSTMSVCTTASFDQGDLSSPDCDSASVTNDDDCSPRLVAAYAYEQQATQSMIVKRGRATPSNIRTNTWFGSDEGLNAPRAVSNRKPPRQKRGARRTKASKSLPKRQQPSRPPQKQDTFFREYEPAQDGTSPPAMHDLSPHQQYQPLPQTQAQQQHAHPAHGPGEQLVLVQQSQSSGMPPRYVQLPPGFNFMRTAHLPNGGIVLMPGQAFDSTAAAPQLEQQQQQQQHVPSAIWMSAAAGHAQPGMHSQTATAAATPVAAVAVPPPPGMEAGCTLHQQPCDMRVTSAARPHSYPPTLQTQHVSQTPARSDNSRSDQPHRRPRKLARKEAPPVSHAVGHHSDAQPVAPSTLGTPKREVASTTTNSDMDQRSEPDGFVHDLNFRLVVVRSSPTSDRWHVSLANGTEPLGVRSDQPPVGMDLEDLIGARTAPAEAHQVARPFFHELLTAMDDPHHTPSWVRMVVVGIGPCRLRQGHNSCRNVHPHAWAMCVRVIPLAPQVCCLRFHSMNEPSEELNVSDDSLEEWVARCRGDIDYVRHLVPQLFEEPALEIDESILLDNDALDSVSPPSASATTPLPDMEPSQGPDRRRRALSDTEIATAIATETQTDSDSSDTDAAAAATAAAAAAAAAAAVTTHTTNTNPTLP